jgi:hypothetical protein
MTMQRYKGKKGNAIAENTFGKKFGRMASLWERNSEIRKKRVCKFLSFFEERQSSRER